MAHLILCAALAAASTTATTAFEESAPGGAPRGCAPACDSSELCLETSGGYRCVARRQQSRQAPAGSELPTSRSPRWIVGLEQVFGLGNDRLEVESGMPEVVDETHFHLLRAALASPMGSAKLALDHRTSIGVTAGGSIGLVYGQGERRQGQEPPRAEQNGIGVFGELRAGYFYELNPHFSLWPKLGLGARKVGGGTRVAITGLRATSTNDESGLSLLPELTFLARVTEVVALAVTAYGGLDLTASATTIGASGQEEVVSVQRSGYGLSLGLYLLL